MTSPTIERADLLDLKLLPAWVKEPVEATNYQRYAGQDEQRDLRQPRDHRGKHPRSNAQRPTPNRRGTDPRKFKQVGRDRRARRFLLTTNQESPIAITLRYFFFPLGAPVATTRLA